MKKLFRILSVFLAAVMIFASAGTVIFAEVEAVRSAPSFDDIYQCALYVRGQMKERVSPISIIYTPGEVNGDITDAIYDRLYDYTGVPNEGDYLRWSIVWMPISYSVGSNEIKFLPLYFSSASEENEVANVLPGVMSSLNLSGKTDYEKFLAIYKYITENVTLDTDQHGTNDFVHYTAYGALVNKKAVNIGYALLLYRMLLTAGIDCRVITGKYNGIGHVWNIVKLGNYYYNVDPCTDAQQISITDENGTVHTGRPYFYMLRGSEYFNATHTSDDEYLTDSFKQNYPISASDYINASNGFTLQVFGNGYRPSFEVFDGSILIVKSDIPCKVGYLGGSAYVNLPLLAHNGDVYYYHAPDGIKDLVIVRCGDTNVDGKLSQADSTKVKAFLKADNPNNLSAIQKFAADVNCDGKISQSDSTKIKAVLKGSANFFD